MVSITTVPALFIGGVTFSILIELFSKSNHFLITYIKHLACGILIAGVYSLMGITFFLRNLLHYSTIAFIYVTIFFIIDLLVKYLESKHIE